MRNTAKKIILLMLVGLLWGMTPENAQAQAPNFTGTWKLDLDKSDDLGQRIRDGAGSSGKITKLGVQRIVERIEQLARAAEEIQIEQTDDDFKIFDKADNVRIYYIDGKKHARQTPWGEKLETQTDWNGNELIISTDGKDLGKVREVYTFDGEQLVFVIQMEHKEFEQTVIARHYYNRTAGR